ncbi:PTS galactitol transporter subunit IIC [Pelolinea submarina]|uniref:PTS system galactitol-specific IIC component n=1 Tax=Pelolinea submarina TaxID=913107 RepID=A0A347ZUD3_9CHLR|nr:PTS transporter subunit IIC [Pelolinea submarina]REG10500.1 PTS system galactitol-specific IIC component [Pelolinea submarina]BBB48914.1 PTS system, galactitol-specific IIC component [Pelolinea submarina]
MNFTNIMASITALPSAVMVPLAILIFSLIAGMKFTKAFRSAILIGAGFVGFSAMFTVFASNIGPAVAAFVQGLGLQLDIADAGVFSLLTATWGSPIAIWFIPIGLGVNILMLILNLTKTLDADILNYWPWGISAIALYALTGNLVIALAGFVINEVIILLIADWTAPKIDEHFDMEGISIPHGNAALWPPLGIAVNWVIEKIPGLRDLEADPDTIAKKFGVFGEPVMLGTILGALIGIIGRQPWGTVLNLAVSLAAVMLLYPRMLQLMMEGLGPISEHLRNFMKEKFNRDVYIGVDAAVLIGQPDVLAVGMILIPIVLGLALILPGNHVLPLADLAIGTPFLISMCMPFLKRGNFVRGLIVGVFIFAAALYISGDLAPLYTKAGEMIGMQVQDGVTWTSMAAGSNWITWILVKIVGLFGYTI